MSNSLIAKHAHASSLK